MNDGSTDNTEELALQLVSKDSRVQYLSKANGGISSARNFGLKHSHGEFIQFLDADDMIERRKLEIQVGAFRLHPEFGIVYGNAKYYDDGNLGTFSRHRKMTGFEQDWISMAWNEPDPLLLKLVKRNILPVCSPIVRRDVINIVGLFNESLRALEDWEYWLRCASMKVAFCLLAMPDTDALIRGHGASLMRDSAAMAAAAFPMRLASQDFLPINEFKARKYNLMRLLAVSSNMTCDGRRARFLKMKAVCKTFYERAIIEIGAWCDSGGIFFPITLKIVRLLPDWFRRKTGI